MTGYEVQIDSDSMILVNIVSVKVGCSWPYLGILDQFGQCLCKITFHLEHVYRGSNCVADALASQALIDEFSSVFYCLTVLRNYSSLLTTNRYVTD